MSVFKDKEIYIIDDDESILLLLTKILENKGVTVKTFTDPQEGLATLTLGAPSLVMLDLDFNESEISGYDILKVRMGDAILPKIPFIVFSGHSGKKHIKQAIELKADDFIPKPINAAVIQAKLKKFFQSEEIKSVTFNENERPSVQANLKGEISHISENCLQITSQMKFAQGTKLGINGPLIKNIGAEICQFETINDAQALDVGYYKNKAKILGVNNQIATNIRRLDF
jgi:DNA-binding NtrC family response regulator